MKPTPYQRHLHRLICEAIITSLENDEKPRRDEIKQYFKRAGGEIETGFCFCPDNQGIIEIMTEEINHA